MATRRTKYAYACLIVGVALGSSGEVWAGELADAAQKGDVALVKTLLQRGEDPNDRSKGVTALHLTDSVPVATELISSGADINAKRLDDGSTPLHFAVLDGNIPLIKLLVARHADVNAVTTQGFRPIHFPVMAYATPKYTDETALEVVTLLVANGADVNGALPIGATARGIAAGNGFSRVAQFLKDRGAKCSLASGLIMHNCRD